MTFTVLDFATASEVPGAKFRRQRPGPEMKLVEEFLAKFPFSVPRGCHASIFCEPRIESGFPDIVVVFWNIATARKWSRERLALTRDDIRLIHHLHQVGPQSISELHSVCLSRLRSSLERLETAELVRHVGEHWKPRPLADSFATRRIIAIEAKITEWAAAIDQAFLNTWFASDSFVLLPQQKPAVRIRATAKSRGVRLCSPKTAITCNRPAFPGKLPRSYASWLFNEWAWRFAALNGGLLA